MRKRHFAVLAALTISVTSLSPLAASADTTGPGVPTNLSTSPTPLTKAGVAQPCGTGTAYASFDNEGGVDSVILSATLNGGNDTAPNYSAVFTVTDETTGTTLAPIDSGGVAPSGDPVSVYAPVVGGHAYSWTAQTSDGTNLSSPAGPCDFISDTTPPTNPVVTSTDFPSTGSNLQSGEPGSFTLTSTDPAPAVGSSPGLKGFSYSFDEPLSVGAPVVAANADGSLTISNQSFSWGTHTLYAQAIDNADTVSGVTQYSFYVPQSPELSPDLKLTDDGALTVIADGSGSTALWPIAQCSFDFGDKTSATTTTGSACTATHEYANLGTYPVTLTITDQYGNQKSVTENFTTPGLSKGTLFHEKFDASGSPQGWGSPAGSTGIAQASNTALPDGSSQLVAVTTAGALEHNIRYASGKWQGWNTVSQPGVTVADASIAGMPNGSSQIIEVTSGGVLKHDIRNANGSWQSTGWGSPAGSTGIAQASITAMPNGDSQLVAVTTAGALEYNIRYASGKWLGWDTLLQTGVTVTDASIAGMPNGSSQFVEVTSTGTLLHDIRNANGTWQAGGWGSPAGSTGIAQASITALPNGSSEIVAVATNGLLIGNVRSAAGSWTHWGQFGQTVHVDRPANTSVAGLGDGSVQVIEVSAI